MTILVESEKFYTRTLPQKKKNPIYAQVHSRSRVLAIWTAFGGVSAIILKHIASYSFRAHFSYSTTYMEHTSVFLK